MFRLGADVGGAVMPGQRGFFPIGAPIGLGFAGGNRAEPGDSAFAGAHHANVAAAKDSGMRIDSFPAVEIANAEAESSGAHEIVEG